MHEDFQSLSEPLELIVPLPLISEFSYLTDPGGATCDEGLVSCKKGNA